MQAEVADGRMKAHKVRTEENPADLMTKTPNHDAMSRHLHDLSFCVNSTRARSAIKLNLLSNQRQHFDFEPNQTPHNRSRNDSNFHHTVALCTDAMRSELRQSCSSDSLERNCEPNPAPFTLYDRPQHISLLNMLQNECIYTCRSVVVSVFCFCGKA